MEKRSEVLNKMVELATGLILAEGDNLLDLYKDRTKVSVQLGLTLHPGKVAASTDIDATITYVAERVREKMTARVYENQPELDLERGLSDGRSRMA